MCIFCEARRWSQRAIGIIPWLIIPLISFWILSQFFPPGWRLEVTSGRVTCVVVLVLSLCWYELVMPKLQEWRTKRTALLREQRKVNLLVEAKWRKEAIRHCRNCRSPYREQSPLGGRFMCSTCGHVSKRPVLGIPGQLVMDNGSGSNDAKGILWWADLIDILSCIESSLAATRVEQAGGWVLHALLKALWPLEWLWSQVSSPRKQQQQQEVAMETAMEDGDAGTTRAEVARKEDMGPKGRGERAKKKAEEKRLARLKKEQQEANDRQEREELTRLVEEQRRRKSSVEQMEEQLQGERQVALQKVREQEQQQQQQAKKEMERKRREREPREKLQVLREKDKAGAAATTCTTTTTTTTTTTATTTTPTMQAESESSSSSSSSSSCFAPGAAAAAVKEKARPPFLQPMPERRPVEKIPKGASNLLFNATAAARQLPGTRLGPPPGVRPGHLLLRTTGGASGPPPGSTSKVQQQTGQSRSPISTQQQQQRRPWAPEPGVGAGHAPSATADAHSRHGCGSNANNNNSSSSSPTPSGSAAAAASSTPWSKVLQHGSQSAAATATSSSATIFGKLPGFGVPIAPPASSLSPSQSQQQQQHQHAGLQQQQQALHHHHHHHLWQPLSDLWTAPNSSSSSTPTAAAATVRPCHGDHPFFLQPSSSSCGWHCVFGERTSTPSISQLTLPPSSTTTATAHLQQQQQQQLQMRAGEVMGGYKPRAPLSLPASPLSAAAPTPARFCNTPPPAPRSSSSGGGGGRSPATASSGGPHSPAPPRSLHADAPPFHPSPLPFFDPWSIAPISTTTTTFSISSSSVPTSAPGQAPPAPAAPPLQHFKPQSPRPAPLSQERKGGGLLTHGIICDNLVETWEVWAVKCKTTRDIFPLSPPLTPSIINNNNNKTTPTSGPALWSTDTAAASSAGVGIPSGGPFGLEGLRYMQSQNDDKNYNNGNGDSVRPFGSLQGMGDCTPSPKGVVGDRKPLPQSMAVNSRNNHLDDKKNVAVAGGGIHGLLLPPSDGWLSPPPPPPPPLGNKVVVNVVSGAVAKKKKKKDVEEEDVLESQQQSVKMVVDHLSFFWGRGGGTDENGTSDVDDDGDDDDDDNADGMMMQKTPPEFVDCITHELMTDPVITADGHSYERSAIERWLKLHDTSPMTGKVLPRVPGSSHALGNISGGGGGGGCEAPGEGVVDKTLRPNHILRSQIREFCERRQQQQQQRRQRRKKMMAAATTAQQQQQHYSAAATEGVEWGVLGSPVWSGVKLFDYYKNEQQPA